MTNAMATVSVWEEPTNWAGLAPTALPPCGSSRNWRPLPGGRDSPATDPLG